MADRPHLHLILIGFVTMLAAFAFQGGAPVVEAIDVEPVIWHLDTDYPETVPGDLELPIRTVYIKTHDGSDWMSTYDSHPFAISGPDAITTLIDIYDEQGIEVAAWFNPTGTDYAAQLEIAKQVIDTGVTALYADVEPYPGFCYLDCNALAENLWKPLRQARPNAHLGVIYDPRPWWWEQEAASAWLNNADSALPMCYWDDYVGQGVWNDAAGCVLQAHSDLNVLAPGKDLDYIPMLQGNSSAAKFEKALDAAVSVGSEKVSVWRRGVVNTEVWELIGEYQEPEFAICRELLGDGCLFREVSDPEVFMTIGGAKFTLVDLETFKRMGLSFNDVQIVEDGFLADLPLVPRNGTLLREEENPEAYIVLGGARFLLADLDFEPLALSPELVQRIPLSTIAQVPTVPADFTRFREVSQVDEYLLIRGMRIHIDDVVEGALAVLGISPATDVAPDFGLEAFPIATVGRGDADCSGAVDPPDVLETLRLSGSIPNGAICYQSADVDCDGAPGTIDALLILIFVGGKTSLVPGCEPIGQIPSQQ